MPSAGTSPVYPCARCVPARYVWARVGAARYVWVPVRARWIEVFTFGLSRCPVVTSAYLVLTITKKNRCRGDLIFANCVTCVTMGRMGDLKCDKGN